MEFEIQFAHDGAVPGLDKVHLTGEMERLEGQASYLVRVLATRGRLAGRAG